MFLVESYLAVVAMRMSGRLTLHWDVPAELRACELPALTIATLVENAVKHGIPERRRRAADLTRQHAIDRPEAGTDRVTHRRFDHGCTRGGPDRRAMPSPR